MKTDPAIPLIDLHRHLENVRLDTILELGRAHNIELPADDAEGLKPYVQVSEPHVSLMAFFEKFRWLTEIMVDYDACRRIAYENVEDAMREVSETLVGEIQRSLDFCRATTSSKSIEQIQLCGGSARVPGLPPLIQERTEVPVEVADPFARIQIPPSADEEQLREFAPALCVAVGLGMRRSSE